MKKFISEFRQFLKDGKVLEVAVGFLLAGAAREVIIAFNDAIIMPIFNYLFNADSLEPAQVTIGQITFPLDIFINSLINFIFIGIILFIVVKIFSKFEKEEKEEKISDEIALLTEIRDLLKENKTG